MKKVYSFLLCSFLLIAFSATANTITDDGTNRDFNLSSGDILTIVKGTYSGDINSFPAGASIVVQAGATFKPKSFNNAAGTLTINGSAVLSSLNLNMPGFALNNYGNLTIGGINFNSAATILNYEGAYMDINGGLMLQSNATLTNSGELHIKGGMDINIGTFINTTGAKIYINGGLNPAGIVINSGYMVVNGGINLNSGTLFTNNCSVVVMGGIVNNATFANNGNVLIRGGFTNNGGSKLTNGVGALMQGTTFENGGTVTGSGNFIFTGKTQNSGSFGEDKGGINFYALGAIGLPTITNQDNQKVYATKNPVPMVDSSSIKNRCNFSNNALPVKLISFDVQNKSANQAIVSWAVAEEINVKEYVVEYSTDGKNFVPKALLLPDNTAPRLYQLPVAITTAPAQYFRLKVVDYDMSVQYSKVQLLTRQKNLQQFTIKINPAKTKTIVALTGNNSNIVTVELLSNVGQPLWKQQVSNPGDNSNIEINDLGRFASGIYYIRVSNGTTVQTQKLLIQ